MSRKLTVSFGGSHQSIITEVRSLEWAEFCGWLVRTPPELPSKEARGWYCGCEFEPVYRHGDNFVARHVLTFDFDHVDIFLMEEVRHQFADYAHALYTTFSHTPDKPRFRLVLPLSRPAGYDEFQAVSRKVAERIGIELVAGESHVVAQFMYAPARREGGKHESYYRVKGKWVDVDEVLAQYEDWTDRATWPHRKEGDNVHDPESKTSPLDKPGIVGDFCRAFSITAAIERFGLPYIPTGVEGRWTYTAGSRPEGAIVYDDDTKLHSHHDTDPGRGQNNAFDLVRVHLFHDLDGAADAAEPITQRPSYLAMCKLAREQPEIRDAVARDNFEDLGPGESGDFASLDGDAEDADWLGERDEGAGVPGQDAGGSEAKPTSTILARQINDVLCNPTSPRWLIPNELERGVIAVMAGPRGVYKSFVALDWSMRIATTGHPVYVVSAEGGDFDRRARAWLTTYAPDRDFASVPLYVVERRLDLNNKEGLDAIRADCVRLRIRPHLFVLDTFSKLSGGLDENENTAVKQFIGRLDTGLKRAETAFDATVLVVAHTGHSDAGRPRGASALGADTDAEYIVARSDANFSISITRERFKASPELSPLYYKPEVVDLGYKGEDGQAVTSLVLRAAEAPTARGSAKKPTGPNQVMMYEVIQELTADGSTVSTTLAVNEAVARTPFDEGGVGRDRRRINMEKAVQTLVANGMVFLHEDNQLSLSELKPVKEEAWLGDVFFDDVTFT